MMRKRLVLLALLLGVSVWQGPEVRATCAVPQLVNAYAHETITVSSTSLGFTAALYDQGSGQAQSALMTVETNAIRFWADGGTPTASVGMPVAAASAVEVCGFANIKNLRMIRQTSDATISVSYFR